MNQPQRAAIGAIAVFGIVAAILILRPGASSDVHDVAHDDHTPAAPAAAAPPGTKASMVVKPSC